MSATRPSRRHPAASAPGEADATSAAAAGWRDGDLAIHHMPGHYIRRLQQVAVALFARNVDDVDITPVQFAALVALKRQRSLDQAALAALIGYDRVTIGGVVDRLEAKRWVAREPGRADRRTKLVSLTPAGAAALRRVTPHVQAVQTALMAPLSAADRRGFERLCRKLLDAHLG
jgi:DNA-binding MarR family transcriptional regulator